MRIILVVVLCTAHAALAAADERLDFFERKIRPVLVEHCYACHAEEGTDIEGGLRLDSRDAMRRGGDSGPAVKPGDLEESLLLSAIKYESFEMPPDRKLPDDIIADFQRWIELGAADPRDEEQVPAETVESQIDFERGREFWSFQPLRKHPFPKHRFEGWPRTRLDHFIASQLERHELEPSPLADAASLRRRLAFDLTGLPPDSTPVQAQLSPEDSEQYALAVDSLLSSPSFGEHWARMWLDLMRFADDQAHIVGSNKSLFFPNSYLYRDWVIDAFNKDMPYDEFVRLQLAADLLTPEDADDDVALGFIGLGPKYYRRNSPEVKAEEWEDRVDVLSRGLLGLTVACARCHDHKFDPIATADYYALAGVFASIEMFNRPLDGERETEKSGEAKDPEDAVHIVREADAVDLSIMIRGDVNRLGPKVPKGFLTVLSSSDSPVTFGEGSGRRELADRIAARDNPLTARVFVNRVWGRLMGEPLVATPSNFGSLGELPSHPELLDDLSVRFMQNGWSLKWLCREIVMSSTYRQSAKSTQGAKVDPANRWLWRMHRKRLTVEQWRDSLLAATGELQVAIGGVSIDPANPESTRRTVYSEASRLKLNPMLALFDYPDPNVHSERRAETTTASQKLFILNSPFMLARAEHLSARLSQEYAGPCEQVEEAYRRLYSRRPSADELEIGVDYLREAGDGGLGTYVHALMAANEVLFLD